MAIRPTAVSFNSLIDACLKRGNKEKAAEFLSKMQLYDVTAPARFSALLSPAIQATPSGTAAGSSAASNPVSAAASTSSLATPTPLPGRPLRGTLPLSSSLESHRYIQHR